MKYSACLATLTLSTALWAGTAQAEHPSSAVTETTTAADDGAPQPASARRPDKGKVAGGVVLNVLSGGALTAGVLLAVFAEMGTATCVDAPCEQGDAPYIAGSIASLVAAAGLGIGGTFLVVDGAQGDAAPAATIDVGVGFVSVRF
ncbi:MAG: hypothetical protein HOW73_27270 [Polyangiaceae bacterium]|nr:hypothetical protein [Polyangiaceae bacterium]